MTTAFLRYIAFSGLLALLLASMLSPIGKALDRVFDDLAAGVVAAAVQ